MPQETLDDFRGRDEASEPFSAADRPSFRTRLLRTVGPALVVALGALALIAWTAAYLVFHQNAVEILEAEVQEMRTDARVQGDSLDLDGYAWEEAHHRLAIDRVDPIFVQVFDADRRLVRVSANVSALSSGYPPRLLGTGSEETFLPALQTFEVGGRTLYYRVAPLELSDGKMAGFVQVARVVPDHQSWLGQLAWVLGGLWIVLSAGLLVLIGWASGRVLRPLRRITEVAQTVTSADLDTRVEVPEGADRETALLGRTLNALLARVEEHVEALRTFTANAAHELQTPLTVLRGHVEIALRRDRPAESYRETLRLLDGKLEELVRTLRALLTLTRLDRGERLETEEVDFAEIVRAEMEELRSRAEAKGLTIRFSSENEDATWVRGEPDLLREGVRNLVDNAVKYTPEGRIDLTVARDDGSVRFTCSDTGIGMDRDEISQITGRFFRGGGAGEVDADGSGLGLALVQRIVDEHRGELEVSSSPGEGTQFTVVLPAGSAP